MSGVYSLRWQIELFFKELKSTLDSITTASSVLKLC